MFSKQDQLRKDLGKMARDGSPEERQFRQELATLAKSRAVNPRLSKASAPHFEAEQRWQSAQTNNYAILFGLLALSGGGGALCMILGVFGSVSVILIPMLLSGLIYGLVVHNRNHRQAFIDLQMSKGMNEMDARREYERKYSSD